MGIYKPRSRMISIRLSDEEYEDFKNLCVVKGARSISDLARAAMNGLMNSRLPDAHVDPHLEEFRTQIQNLDRKINDISARLVKPLTE